MNVRDRGLVDELQLRADSRPRPAAILRVLTPRVLLAMIQPAAGRGGAPALDPRVGVLEREASARRRGGRGRARGPGPAGASESFTTVIVRSRYRRHPRPGPGSG